LSREKIARFFEGSYQKDFTNDHINITIEMLPSPIKWVGGIGVNERK